ncbi:MAG: glycohydrolase toxin TNT-related protein [Mycobacterium sp.]|uniref:glycohydrolase toxin TNT-related protein n=1 Tax=Mycobacterium sp. TaxID=1785 RepID=UPI002614AF49|nr:glycohydrolase toxin TNT-related protein [Mycobacterium sp.]MDI3313435.1 glycohydrolase toxin TNT-related protein [Mycobacterium sp.]
MADGKPASWEQRALHVDSLSQPYHAYVLDHLPEGYRIEVSEVEPAVGQPGGALQVRILDESGKVLRVEQLLKEGVLR